MNKRIISIAIIVLIIGGLAIAMKKHAPKPAKPTTQELWLRDGIPVETGVVIKGDIEQTIEITGDINALDKVTLSSKIPGRVAKVLFREGDYISKGQTVIILDQDDAKSNLQQAQAGVQNALARLSQAKTSLRVAQIQANAAIAQAEAGLKSAKAMANVARKPARTQEEMVAENNVASAKANLDNAEANYRRHEQLLKEGAISQALFDTIKSQYLVAKAQYKSAQDQLSLIREGGRKENVVAAESNVEVAQEQLRTAKANAAQVELRKEDVKSAEAALDQARAALAIAKQQLENTYIRSTVSGKLNSRLTEPGQVVSPGQALGEVVNTKMLYFKGNLSEIEVSQVKEGMPVRVRIDAIPDKTFDAFVDKIYPAGSTASRNFPVRIRLTDENSPVRPGMFARGNIVTGIARNVMLVPKDAIDRRRGTNIVFTLNGNNTVKRYDVEIVAENAQYAQLKQPVDISVGSIVITAGKQNLQDGSKVRVNNGKK